MWLAHDSGMHALFTLLSAALLYYVLRYRASPRLPLMGVLGACLVALCAPICGRLLGYALFPVLATPLVLWYMERTGSPNRLSRRAASD